MMISIRELAYYCILNVIITSFHLLLCFIIHLDDYVKTKETYI